MEIERNGFVHLEKTRGRREEGNGGGERDATEVWRVIEAPPVGVIS